jgi:hypothetical protein
MSPDRSPAVLGPQRGERFGDGCRVVADRRDDVQQIARILRRSERAGGEQLRQRIVVGPLDRNQAGDDLAVARDV